MGDDKIQSSLLNFLLSFFSLLERLITGGFLEEYFFLEEGGSKKLSSSMESKKYFIIVNNITNGFKKYIIFLAQKQII